MQNLTIGGGIGIRDNPIIADNVLIESGTGLLGHITIGNNAKISANVVVLKSVTEFKTFVGISGNYTN